MSCTLNRDAFEKLIAENLEWLLAQPRTLERDHIEAIVRAAPDEHCSIERRIAEAVAAEREACAKICAFHASYWAEIQNMIPCAQQIAAAIRARSNQPLVTGSPLQKADTHVVAASQIGESGE